MRAIIADCVAGGSLNLIAFVGTNLAVNGGIPGIFVVNAKGCILNHIKGGCHEVTRSCSHESRECVGGIFKTRRGWRKKGSCTGSLEKEIWA